MKKSLLFLSILMFCFQPALAIDQGTAMGTLMVNDEKIVLAYSYAHFHDNAEGLLDKPKELRIVLSDREIPQESLRGIIFLPVEDLAREGKVQGLLMQFDPDDKTKILVTLLRPPSRAGSSLMTLTLVDSTKNLFKRMDISKRRVTGDIDHVDTRKAGSDDLPQLSFSAKFDAPLFHELPVTADLKGKAAQGSPLVKVLREKIDALKKGDFDAVKRISTERANRTTTKFLAQMGDQAKVFAKEAAGDLEQSLKTMQRIVVRGDDAVMIFSKKGWATFRKEGGQWKSDD
jgi:hypothetical protein